MAVAGGALVSQHPKQRDGLGGGFWLTLGDGVVEVRADFWGGNQRVLERLGLGVGLPVAE